MLADGKGKTNRKTVHTGCPILIGDKWITQKWFRTIENNLLCSINDEFDNDSCYGWDIQYWAEKPEREKHIDIKVWITLLPSSGDKLITILLLLITFLSTGEIITSYVS